MIVKKRMMMMMVTMMMMQISSRRVIKSNHYTLSDPIPLVIKETMLLTTKNDFLIA